MLDVEFIRNKLMRCADDIARAEAEAFAKALRKNLTKKSGVTSSPGEFPAKQSGDLVGSIQINRRRVGDSVSYQVKMTADHAEAVDKVRPFFERTLNESEKLIMAAAKQAGKRQGLRA